ncbi:ATP-binding protein of sugar ABC transporter [Janibacter sp. HTCC2649]|uniref:ABC transporter ATP-binding protein n=1 Tax=Janibacter sp. HTCC2649 TaxID=313589 RepID=UPI0000670D4E|nr:ATP-binding cassette domain-containing protein [Janibacter sp. HTCC2649]EAQ00534.1 ATP-binding protein of sugar ABC transporter [Janibacter sp. HTCC2649]
MDVRAEDVSKVIGPATLLAPVTVTAPSGSCLVLRGPNGSGKTTLLRILIGMMPATTGQAFIGETKADERDPAVRAAVAALAGAPATYRDLTLRDHLVLLDATWAGDADTTDERVAAALSSLGIGALGGRFPHELSSGQTQLFRLALTLFRPSSVLVLDEPEQRLDTSKRTLVAELIAARRDAGTTVVLACHDPIITERVTAGSADQVVDLVAAEG